MSALSPRRAAARAGADGSTIARRSGWLTLTLPALGSERVDLVDASGRVLGSLRVVRATSGRARVSLRFPTSVRIRRVPMCVPLSDESDAGA